MHTFYAANFPPVGLHNIPNIDIFYSETEIHPLKIDIFYYTTPKIARHEGNFGSSVCDTMRAE